MTRPPWHQFLTIAGALAVVNSVLIGGVLGLAVQAGTRTLAASAAVGVITDAAALAAHFTRQRRPGGPPPSNQRRHLSPQAIEDTSTRAARKRAEAR